MVRRQLRSLLWVYAIAVLTLLVVGLLSRDGKTTMLAGLNLAAWLLLHLLLRADKLQTTGLLACMVLLGTATYATWTSFYGLLDSTAIIFAVVAVFAVLLLDRPWWVLVIGLTVVDIFVIGYRAELRLIVEEESANILLVDPVIVSVVVTMLAVAIRRQQNHLWQALGKALIQEQVLQQQTLQLQTSERRWRTLVHAAPEWVLQVDRDGVIRFTNREDHPNHGNELDRPVAELVEAPFRTATTEALCEVLAGRQPAPLAVDMILGGELRHCVMNLGPLDGPDGVTGAIILISDETDRRHLQLQLEQAQRLDSLGRLAGGIAHDFNNLLTVISGHTDLASTSGGTDDSLSADLEAIRDACDRASDLTGQILAFGRRQPQQTGPIRLNDTVQGLAPMLHRLLGEDIDLAVDLAPDLAPVVADAAQMEQVVVNLVVNARDAVREAERQEARTAGDDPSVSNSTDPCITIRTRPLETDSAAAKAADWFDEAPVAPGAILEVVDAGNGMDESIRLRAFEPFFSTKPKGEGTGLGLAMVYGIMKQNRGAVRIDSTPGVGTSVQVALPSRPDLVVAAEPGIQDAEPKTIGRGEHILLVEDDDAVRQLTRRTLQLYGYRVVETASVAEAVAAAHEHADLAAVVTDIVMPGGSGLELVDRLPGQLPILFTSGYASDTSQETMNAIPDGCFLQKPYLPSKLAAVLRGLLDRD